MSDPRIPVFAERTLEDLLPELAGTPQGALRVGGVCLDSRRVSAGDAFIALRGARHDGAAYVDEAARRGARVVLFDQGDAVSSAALEAIGVSRLGERVSEIAGRFYGEPSQSMTLIGVTGTNGKTTCTQLIAQAFELLGTRCGVVGTLGWGFPGRLDATMHTTPDAVSLQQMLAGLRAAGATAAALEVSSHALKQGRVRGLRFATAIFTNLTHDHLDYHGSFEDYGASKQMLFASERLKNAVINSDDPFGRRLLDALPRGVDALSYGVAHTGARVRAIDPLFSADGLAAQVVTPWGRGTLRTPLL